MMIGPEPIIRMRWISVRLGMRYKVYEIVKEVSRIVRAGGGFGMILHAKHGVIAEPETFERLVVEIDVGDLAFARVERVGIHGESVVVRSDLDLIGNFVDHRMIHAAMSELHLVGLAAHGEAQNLIAQTDAEDGNLADQSLHVADLSAQGLGGAGAVRWEHA